MFTFLPALILLFLHGPSHFERQVALAGTQADIGAQATRVATARSNRAWIAELLSQVPSETLLAALGIAPRLELAAAPSRCRQVGLPPYIEPYTSACFSLSQRDRDGPSNI
jgi:hypothetical protein